MDVSRRSMDFHSWSAMLITLPWVLGCVVVLVNWRHAINVASRERTTLGLITKHEPSNHNQFRYSFAIGSTNYAGLSASASENTFVGERVTVYYDPRDPSTSSLADFAAGNGQAIGILFFAGTGTLTVAGIIGVNKLRAGRSATS